MMKSLPTKISCWLLVLMQFKGTGSAYIFPSKPARYLKACFRLSQDFKFSQQQVARPAVGLRSEEHLLVLPIGMVFWSTPLRLSLPTQPPS